MRIISVIFRVILIVFIIVLLAINGWVLINKLVFNEELPRFFGYSQAVVISGSMEPALSVDDMIIAKEKDSYEVGDIIIFYSGSSFITHRITKIENGLFTTKGDANNISDSEPCRPDQIYGEVVYSIKGIGNVLSFVRTPLGTVAIIGIGIILFVLSDVLDRFKSREPRKKIRRPHR